MRIFLVFSWLIISLLFLTTSSRAEESSTDKLLDLLQEKHLITPEEAAGFRAEQAMKEAEGPKTPKLEVGPTGFRLSSYDGAHFVNIRGSVQTDGKFFMDDKDNTAGSNLTDKFELKQARIRLEGRLLKYFDFKIMPDFGGGSIRLQDAFFDTHYFSFASLNVGKQKAPLILERLQGDNDFTFLERAYPTYLASNRDVGVMLHGEFARPGYDTEYSGPLDFKNFVSYQLGVFNGVGDNGFSNNTDIDDNKEFAGRIWAHPLQPSGIAMLAKLGIGVSGSWQQPHNESLTNLPSPNGQNTIVDYSKRGSGITSLTASGGDHFRVSPQAYWYYGHYGLLGEYAVSSQELLAITGGQKADIRQENKAWQVQASYVVTGEDNTFQSVKPRENFGPRNGKWGALQLAARLTALDIDDDTFVFLDPSMSVTKATTWTVGANWFLNRYTRIMADYEETYFDGGAANGGDRQTEKVFSTRFQLSF